MSGPVNASFRLVQTELAKLTQSEVWWRLACPVGSACTTVKWTLDPKVLGLPFVSPGLFGGWIIPGIVSLC